MQERVFVTILSDIHIGTDSPTVWYRKEVHEKYLIAIFDEIISNANQIREVILLGDIFEFWAYSPDEIPPTLDEIIKAHPNILGSQGKLIQMLSVLQGRIVYIPGDHDMNMNQEELNKFKSADGYTIKYNPDAYIPYYDTNIVFTHGHEFTLLNAPYYGSKLAPLPIGYFMNRAISYKIKNILRDRPGETIANLEEFGTYSLDDFLSKLPNYLNNYQNGPNYISKLIDATVELTGIPKDLKIHVNKTTAVSLNEVKKIYNNIYIPWYIRKNLFKGFSDIVVMGHTHYPILTKKNGKTHYVNTGFMCPSIAKFKVTPITYGIFYLPTRSVSIKKITDSNSVNKLQYRNKIKMAYKDGDVCLTYKSEIKNLLQLPAYAYENELNVGSYDNIIEIYKCNQNNNVEKVERNKRKYSITSTTTKIEEITKTTINKFVFGWSVYNASWEYYLIMQLGVLSKAEELGIKVLKHDQKSNTEEMITGCIELINKDVDALLISPYNPEGVPFIVSNANKSQIPVVVIDGGTGGADVAAFIVSDSFGGGILAGEYALILINKYSIKSKNAAIIKAEKTATYALLRGQGFKVVMVENGYRVVAEVSAEGEENPAYEAVKLILDSNENNLAVIFCENGPMTIGAARAIDEAGKKGIIMLIGFDADSSVIAGIKNGSIQGTIAQQPFKMGQIGVETANDVLLGKPVTYDDPTQKLILMEVYLIDESGEIRSNVI